MKMPSSPGFSPGTAAIFIFNLVVGTGALALPNAFEQATSSSFKSLLAPTGALYVTMRLYKLTEQLTQTDLVWDKISSSVVHFGP